MITPLQIRIARAILRWTVDDLSKKSEIGWARVQHLEKIDKRLKPSGYYKEDKDLPLGSELIFLICKFYDKTINRRRIMKDVFKNYKRIKEQVRRIDQVIQH